MGVLSQLDELREKVGSTKLFFKGFPLTCPIIFRRTPSVIQKRMPSYILHNEYLQTIFRFLQTNPECIKFRENSLKTYYLRDFEPLADYNLEFIFRQLPTLYGAIENERIAAVSTCHASHVCLGI